MRGVSEQLSLKVWHALKRRMGNRFQDRSSSGQGQDETRSQRGEMDSIDHSAESFSESSTTSTHRSLGRPYTHPSPMTLAMRMPTVMLYISSGVSTLGSNAATTRRGLKGI